MSQSQVSLFLPAYEDVTVAFFRAALEVTPAECHGLLTGLILSGVRDTQKALDEILENVDDNQADAVTDYFQEIFQVSGALLEDENFIYELLLPDDAVEISERLLALSEWCRGFLTAVNVENASHDGTEVKEAIEAVQQISEIDPYVEQSEQAENDYWQLVEFLRLSVILIYEDRRSAGGKMASLAGVASEYIH